MAIRTMDLGERLIEFNAGLCELLLQSEYVQQTQHADIGPEAAARNGGFAVSIAPLYL
jgi:hypothetical protein